VYANVVQKLRQSLELSTGFQRNAKSKRTRSELVGVKPRQAEFSGHTQTNTADQPHATHSHSNTSNVGGLQCLMSYDNDNSN